MQAIIESFGQTSQIHLTFFADGGGALDVSAVSMSGTSPTGSVVDIPVDRFEEGHFAATVELEPGSWTFVVSGVADGQGVEGTFDVRVE